MVYPNLPRDGAMVYLFEGPLPYKTCLVNTRTRAPRICVTKGTLQFLVYVDYTMDGLSRRTRYPLYARPHVADAFKLINRRFVGDGFYRAALSDFNLYLEIVYDVDYTTLYRAARSVYVYKWVSSDWDWELLSNGRLTAAVIDAHDRATQRKSERP